MNDDREALIEKAVEWLAKSARRPAQGSENFPQNSDDEREALVAILEAPLTEESRGRTFSEMLADAILAAGIRRTAVQEPSADEREAARAYADAEYPELALAPENEDRADVAERAFLAGALRRPVQAETTDDELGARARILAKLDRIPDSDAVTLDKADVRAAVRRPVEPPRHPALIANRTINKAIQNNEVGGWESTIRVEQAHELIVEALTFDRSERFGRPVQGEPSAKCPQPCEHLSQEDAREGRTCAEHPCTCEPTEAQVDHIPGEPFTLDQLAAEHERLAEHPNQMRQTVPAFHTLTAKALRWAALRAAAVQEGENR